MLMINVCTWLHAPPFRFAFSASPLPTLCRCSFPMATSCRIAVVGDVHDDWSLEEDTRALQLLKPDLVLLTGDFGNENVDLVRSISSLEFPKAVILGNHDAWNTQKFSSREKDAVQLQLEALGDEHVGYRRMDFPDLKLSIVGGRPFSCGGEQLFRKKLLTARYGVRDMEGSAKRIYEATKGTPADHSIVFLAHNGPKGIPICGLSSRATFDTFFITRQTTHPGLGSNEDDICGKDWTFVAGDHGDPDLASTISQIKETTDLCIKLVVFGHMHKHLAYGKGHRKMIVVGDDNIVYLNGAIVPRVKTIGKEQVSSSTATSNIEGTLRAFTVVDILDGSLEKIAETWVSVNGDKFTIEDEFLLLSKGSRI